MNNQWRGKSIFLTGHTGFKGAWLSRILQIVGANVTGYSLTPEPRCAYKQIVDPNAITSYIADIRNYNLLKSAFDSTKPEIVFHLAAQPLVLEAFGNPAYTFDVNVQGTVNILECCRHSNSVKSVVIITTDKVYHNNEWEYGYRETDALGDTEPYAASKSCAEIVTASYRETFLKSTGIAISTARAGNVIGGGDISSNRIVPDCVRAAKRGEPIIVRNPGSVRPYQHVLEPLFSYLLIAEKQIENSGLSGQYNVGPNENGCITTEKLVRIFCQEWGHGQNWINQITENAPRESGLLKLDCSKIRSSLNWMPKWGIEDAVAKTIEWEKNEDKQAITDKQILEYKSLCMK